MSVEFYKDKALHHWRIVDDDEIIHVCHEGFRSEHEALQNLFINHTMMSIFVASVAQGTSGSQGDVLFEIDPPNRIRWKIRTGNHETVGQSYISFGNTLEAMDNLIITYTMLTVFVAEMAQVKSLPRKK